MLSRWFHSSSDRHKSVESSRVYRCQQGMDRLDSLAFSSNDLNHYPKSQKGEKQDHLNLIIHVTFGSLIHLKPASFRLDIDLNVFQPLQVFLS